MAGIHGTCSLCFAFRRRVYLTQVVVVNNENCWLAILPRLFGPPRSREALYHVAHARVHAGRLLVYVAVRNVGLHRPRWHPGRQVADDI